MTKLTNQVFEAMVVEMATEISDLITPILYRMDTFDDSESPGFASSVVDAVMIMVASSYMAAARRPAYGTEEIKKEAMHVLCRSLSQGFGHINDLCLKAHNNFCLELAEQATFDPEMN
jgi:hypothetical protein